MLYGSRVGGIDILGVTSLDEPKISLSYDVIESAQLLWVNLDMVLEPYERASFEIEFTSFIPEGGFDRANSHGSDVSQSRIYKFTSFYPMPCVHDQFDGWNVDPYIDSCDPFYHDMAYYYFMIEAPVGMVIAATGEMIDKTNNGSTNILHFDPEYPVREVTFAASRYFSRQTTIVNGINISAYYLSKSSLLWEDHALNYAENALELFSSTFGAYPYSTLNIVEEYSYYSGMEYPLQVYISEGIDNYDYPISVRRQMIEKTIVHETAHQWWYNLVGFDQIDWGFMDEGLTCWSVDYYAKVYHGSWYYFQFTRYFDRVRTDHSASRVNQSVYQIIENNLDFVFISYYKSPLIFEKISRSLGLENFLLGLQSFFEEFQFKIALLADLHQVLEETENQSLDWLIFPWFDNYYLPKYKITKLSFDDNAYDLMITIEDENEQFNQYSYSQQVTLIVYDKNGGILHDNLVWINSTTSLILPMTGKPDKVRLEYGNDVLVQLSSTSKTYIEKSIEEDFSIIGYDASVILMVCSLLLPHLIYKASKKRKN